MHDNMKKNLLLYFVSAVFFIPMFILNRDLWDGVIISHAFKTESPEIYWNWFIESGWFITPYFYDAFYYLFHEHDFLRLFYLFYLGCHVFSAHQIYLLSRRTFKFDEWPSFTVCAIFALSPLWNIYFSTVFLMHAFTLALALCCVNQLLKYKVKSFVVFSIVSLVSFQQASMPPIIMAILFLDYLLHRNKEKSIFIVFYVALSVTFFLWSRYAFPAHGLYENYNSMNLANLFSWASYKVFANYLVDVYPLFIPLFFLSLFLSKDKIKVLFFSGLIFAAILPFILVGKPAWPSHLYVIEGWDQRQAITLTVAIAVIFGLIHMTFSVSRYRQYSNLAICISVILLAYKLYNSVEIKIKSVLIQDSIVSLLKENKGVIGECGVILTIDASPAFRNLSSYELSYLAWEAFGERKHIYFSTRKQNNLNVKDIYRDKYILPDKYPQCMKSVILHTNIEGLNLYEMFSGYKLKQSFEIKEVKD